MFKIYTPYNSENSLYSLAFLKSNDVYAFPCGRRRSTEVTEKKDEETITYRIPFDPEARLNTEANNRRHSSLNGFTQTYLKNWDVDNQLLQLSLGGYLFSVDLSQLVNLDGTKNDGSPAQFGAELLKELNANILDANKEIIAGKEPEADKLTNAEAIYANILISKTNLFSYNTSSYKTEILDSQSASKDSSSLDLIIDSETGSITNKANYYFSGLSFSVLPFTDIDTDKEGFPTYSTSKNNDDQQVISLRILEKVDNVWQEHQPALLPEIEHGNTAGSIKVNGDVEARTISATDMLRNGVSVPSLQLVQIEDKYQLQFSSVKINKTNNLLI